MCCRLRFDKDPDLRQILSDPPTGTAPRSPSAGDADEAAATACRDRLAGRPRGPSPPGDMPAAVRNVAAVRLNHTRNRADRRPSDRWQRAPRWDATPDRRARGGGDCVESPRGRLHTAPPDETRGHAATVARRWSGAGERRLRRSAWAATPCAGRGGCDLPRCQTIDDVIVPLRRAAYAASSSANRRSVISVGPAVIVLLRRYSRSCSVALSTRYGDRASPARPVMRGECRRRVLRSADAVGRWRISSNAGSTTLRSMTRDAASALAYGPDGAAAVIAAATSAAVVPPAVPVICKRNASATRSSACQRPVPPYVTESGALAVTTGARTGSESSRAIVQQPRTSSERSAPRRLRDVFDHTDDDGWIRLDRATQKPQSRCRIGTQHGRFLGGMLSRNERLLCEGAAPRPRNWLRRRIEQSLKLREQRMLRKHGSKASEKRPGCRRTRLLQVALQQTFRLWAARLASSGCRSFRWISRTRRTCASSNRSAASAALTSAISSAISASSSPAVFGYSRRRNKKYSNASVNWPPRVSRAASSSSSCSNQRNSAMSLQATS